MTACNVGVGSQGVVVRAGPRVAVLRERGDTGCGVGRRMCARGSGRGLGAAKAIGDAGCRV